MISYYHLSVVGKSAKTDDVSLSVLIISEHFKTSNRMFSVRCKFKTGATRLAIQSVFHRKFLFGWSKEPFSPLVVQVTQFLSSSVISKNTMHVEAPSSTPSTAQMKICLLIPSARFVICTPFLHTN